jgi:TonB-dependent SusC/RagA subfamily outer membrane receptor
MKSTGFFLLLSFICVCQISSGQKVKKNIIITGFVTDAKQKPVENTAIFIDKVKTNSVTDKKGYYKVKASLKAREIMVFSFYTGYVKVPIEGRTTIDFILPGESGKPEENVTDSDNETISTGYGTMKKKDSATRVNKIDGQSQRFAGYQDIYDMLRGAVPGVGVSGKSIKVMGSSSLNANTEPLFVVDGVMVNSIDNISPQIVKSIEVLKGPAASVYGIRGANGVILINLLSGIEDKTK